MNCKWICSVITSQSAGFGADYTHWPVSAFCPTIDIRQWLGSVQYPADNRPNIRILISALKIYVFTIYRDAKSGFKFASQSWPDCDTVIWLIIGLETQVPSSYGVETPLATSLPLTDNLDERLTLKTNTVNRSVNQLDGGSANPSKSFKEGSTWYWNSNS